MLRRVAVGEALPMEASASHFPPPAAGRAASHSGAIKFKFEDELLKDRTHLGARSSADDGRRPVRPVQIFSISRLKRQPRRW
jgi:hypothetical protein